MPLDGSGTATKPSGTTATPNTTIESAKFNSVIDDVYSILNTARPITKGGTGATSASAARTALGLAIGSDVQAYSAGITSVAAAFTPASASTPAALAFAEDTDNGVHKITVIAPASLAADQVITWPDITDTLVGLAAAQTLTNKTLTAPAIVGATLTGAIDASGATEMKIPVSATPTVNANGEIALDTTVSDWSHGIIRAYGGEELGIVAMPIAEFAGMSDGQVIAYNATNDEFELVTPTSGGMTLLGTISTASGTTADLTGLNLAGYNYLVLLVEGLSFTGTSSLQIATSSTNGSAWGTAGTISQALTGSGGFMSGKIEVYNINSNSVSVKTASSNLRFVGAGAGTGSVPDAACPTDTGAPVNALRLSGGTFDNGSVRVYGVK